MTASSTMPPPRANLDFRRLLEALPAAAYTCDAHGLITYYNRRAVVAWGREPKLNDPDDRYCGSFRMSTVDGEWVPHNECWMARCLKERRAFDGEEIVVQRQDGTQLVVLAHAIPLFDDAGALTGAVNVVVDITGRKRTERQLQERERELAETSRRKDEFLATLAHELRNPLAPIRNSLHLLRLAAAGNGGPTQVHEMLERQVGNLVRLVDDLMDVSRITRDLIELRREPVELAGALNAAVETAKPMIEAGEHELTVVLPSEPLILEADPVRLTQIIANLLNNAAKYSEPGGRIRLEGRREGTRAVVSVRDTGMGIPSELLPNVFDLFTQLDRTYSRKHGGLGIGLTLVKRLVEMHGGQVEAHSEGPGRGSEFVVRLPLAIMAPTARAWPTATAASVAQRRILVVDDNRDAAESLGLLLKFQGADVHVVHDGPAALAALTMYRPSIVLLDIGMPGMDGYELARRMRQRLNGDDVTLIALTGWGQKEDQRLSKEAGIDHHLIKPVDCDMLVDMLAGLSQAKGS
jgi:signal transduction histidine kinase/ActR/RegA family two-component response regulator